MNKIKQANINYQVKAELGDRKRIDRATWLKILTCRGGEFLSKVDQGDKKLKMRLDLAKFLED